MCFKLKCEGVIDNFILKKYGKYSDDIVDGIPQKSFPLGWSGIPDKAESVALSFVDYDNIQEEGIMWVHWLIANIPTKIDYLPEGSSTDITALSESIVQGCNTWIIENKQNLATCLRYGGPYPSEFDHEYEIKIYALNKFLELDEGYKYNEFLKEIRGSVIAEDVIYAKYSS